MNPLVGAAGTGSVAERKFRCECGGGRGNEEVVGYRGEPSDRGVEEVVVVCHWRDAEVICSPMALQMVTLLLFLIVVSG